MAGAGGVTSGCWARPWMEAAMREERREGRSFMVIGVVPAGTRLPGEKPTEKVEEFPVGAERVALEGGASGV